MLLRWIMPLVLVIASLYSGLYFQFDTSAKKYIGLVQFLFVYSTPLASCFSVFVVCRCLVFVCFVLFFPLQSVISTATQLSINSSSTTLCTCSVYYQQQRWQQINQNYAHVLWADIAACLLGKCRLNC